MKIRLIILLLFIGTSISFAADAPSRERDSIIARINAIENDTLRYDCALLEYNKYVRSPFARDINDKLYEVAVKLNDKRKEIVAMYGYYTVASTTEDTVQMRVIMNRIEEHAYKYNLQDDFFRYNRHYLMVMASSGNIEWVVIEANKMKKEAERLNSSVGIVCSQIALVQAYKYAKNTVKIIETHEALLESGLTIDFRDKLAIYYDLYGSNQSLGNHRERMKYIQLEKELLEKIMADNPKMKIYYDPRLFHNEVAYAETYMELGEYDKALEYLRMADKHYTPSCFVSYYCLYHMVYAKYYAHIGEWNRCIESIDKSIDRLGNTQPLLKSKMMVYKVKFLEQAGRFSEAIPLHRAILAAKDSLNRLFIQKQEEALAANYRWEMGLIKKAENTYTLGLILVISVILILIVISGFFSNLYRTHIKVRRAKDEAEKAGYDAIVSNRLRNTLLTNISKEIETPLNQIKGASAQTITTTDKALVQSIEKDATNMIRLLDIVVELSELEAEATKFNITQVDILSLCHQAVKLVGEHGAVVCFTSEIESCKVRIDYDKMLSCLCSAMLNFDGSESSYRINFNVKYSDSGDMVVMEIIGSPLSNISCESQIQTLRNHVNSIIVRAFGGICETKASNLRPTLTISLPYRER